MMYNYLVVDLDTGDYTTKKSFKKIVIGDTVIDDGLSYKVEQSIRASRRYIIMVRSVI